jgi:hypothetical protein
MGGAPVRVSHQYTQHLHAAARDIFPLICPVREAEWLPGFAYTMLYSESGVAEPGCVFATSKENEPDTVWCITRHDPKAGRVEFHRFTPGLLLTHIVVQLEDAPGGCTAEIGYAFTSLSARGDDHVRAHLGESAFLEMVQRWEDSLNRYLSAG